MYYAKGEEILLQLPLIFLYILCYRLFKCDKRAFLKKPRLYSSSFSQIKIIFDSALTRVDSTKVFSLCIIFTHVQTSLKCQWIGLCRGQEIIFTIHKFTIICILWFVCVQ